MSEPEPQDDPKAAGRRLALADAARLPVRYWLIVGLGAVFTLARFSEAFLVLRAHDLGVGMGMVPAVMVVMNLVYAGCAYPAGAAADRHPARWLLFLGLVILVVADVVWALADRPWVAFAGAGLWGLHLACTQGLLTKLVADTAPAELRGTAFGVTNLVSGAALLMASAIAGWLWSTAGPAATFAAGAAFAAVAAAGLLVVRPRAGRVVAAG